MLTIKFPGYPKARAIIIDKPVNKVNGIVECEVCDWHMVLMAPSTEETSSEIEEFVKNHKCLPLAKEEEIIAFAARLKKGMPSASVRVMKGQKLIKLIEE